MRAHEIEETSIQIGVETLSPLSLCGGLEAMNPDSSCCWKKEESLTTCNVLEYPA